MKTIVYSTHGFDKSFLEKAVENKHELIFTEEPLNISTVHLAEGCKAIALFTGDRATAEVLGKLRALGVRFIALRSVGYDHVDLEKAKELDMKVANVPAYSPYAIAEHAVMLILALNRKLLLGQQLMGNNDFRMDRLVGSDIHSKTVGIVGTGKIGTAFANIMHGFGSKLLAYDLEENASLIKATGIHYTSLKSICEKADIIAIHCPLTKETNHLFNKELFSIMKKGVVLINTARGAIINTIDLIEALDNGIVAAAGLDVYEYESAIYFKNQLNEPINDALFQQLRAYPNVLLTGHQAFLTNEALTGIATTTIQNLDAWEAKGESENELS